MYTSPYEHVEYYATLPLMRLWYKSACDTHADNSNLFGGGQGGDDDDGGSDDVRGVGSDGGGGCVVVMVLVMVVVLEVW